MRVSTILGFAFVLAVSTTFAQKPKTYHSKTSGKAEQTKAVKSMPAANAPMATSNANKDLRRIEQQSMKAPAGGKAGGAKGGSSAFKSDKPKATTPINASGGTGMGTNTKIGTPAGAKNPYKGRLRQKGGH